MKVRMDWICKYCGNKFKGRRNLYKHYKICEEKEKLPKDSLGRIKPPDRQYKAGETIRKKILSGELKYEGHPIDPETRAKLAQKMKERKNIINCQCNYNIEACKYIDNLNKEKGWNLQHALNGGECKIGPYHVDGYDKELNIAFEYDENKPKHTSIKGQLKDKCRQAYIIEKTNCDFWRYSEKDHLLYKVDKEENLKEIKLLQEQCPKTKIINILKIKKEKKKIYKNKILEKQIKNKENGILQDSIGRYNHNKFNEEIWIERKNRILTCGIDLTKFGWVGKVEKETGYTKRIIEDTLERFKDDFEGKYFRRN